MPPLFRRMGVIVGLAVVANLILALRFSPDWFRFLAQAREAEAAATDVPQLRAIDRAFASGAAERGARVIDQKHDLGSTIEDPLHQALRWRLFAPAIGRLFGLSDWATLGLAHAGCVALILILVALGTPQGNSLGMGGLWLALTAGATAPLITSMGWLGYYDSLLALGLLAVAFARRQTVVVLACLLTPWVDERFVLALPLALLVRWNRSDRSDAKPWLRREAMVPIALTVAFALTRLALGGTGGSQTVADYVRTFILGQEITAADRLFGAWSGLRLSWLIVAAGLAAGWSQTTGPSRSRAQVLAAVALAIAMVGACSAQDTARAMVLLFPLIPWAWQSAAGRWPRAWPWIGPLLALVALLAPAHQVFGRISTPVPPAVDRPADHPLVRAQNNLGYLHERGEAGARNVAEARKWYARAAAAGLAEAQFNLAMVILRSETAAAEAKEAERWLLAAARQGLAPAQRTLTTLYLGNHGVEKNLPLAWAWLGVSDAPAESTLALFNQLTPAEQAEALRLKTTLSHAKTPAGAN